MPAVSSFIAAAAVAATAAGTITAKQTADKQARQQRAAERKALKREEVQAVAAKEAAKNKPQVGAVDVEDEELTEQRTRGGNRLRVGRTTRPSVGTGLSIGK